MIFSKTLDDKFLSLTENIKKNSEKNKLLVLTVIFFEEKKSIGIILGF